MERSVGISGLDVEWTVLRVGGFIIFEGVLRPSFGDVTVVGAVVVVVVEGIRNFDIGS